MEVGWEDKPLKTGGAGHETREIAIEDRKENANILSFSLV